MTERFNCELCNGWGYQGPEIVCKQCNGEGYFHFSVGETVEKFTGDYRLDGEVRAIFKTRRGKTRYVVEHEPGFLHIYSGQNIRKITHDRS